MQDRAKGDIISGVNEMSPRVAEWGAARYSLEGPKWLSQLGWTHHKSIGKPEPSLPEKRFSLSLFHGGFDVGRFFIIALVLVFLSPLISATLSAADNSEDNNLLKSKALPDKPLRTIIVPDYYPYTFVNDKGVPDGFSVDLAKAVVRAMDMTLEISVNTWERAREALENGTIDFLPMMAASPLRRQSFDFSVPHTIAYDAVFVRRGTQRIASLNDLAGKTIIVMNKDAAHDFVLTTSTSGTNKLILVDSLPDGLRVLAAGAGDAAIMPKLVGLLLVKKLGIANVEESPVTIESYKRPFSFAVKKGNTALLESLGQGLSIVDANSQYRDIYDKWFGVLAPRGLPWKSVFKYICGIIGAFALVGMVLLAWSLSLKKRVTQRTKTLESEILARKKMEAALRESEERYRILFENAAVGMDLVDSNGRLLQVNGSLAEMLGYTEDELVNLTFFDISHPDDVEISRAKYEEMVRGGTEAYRFEKRYIRKNGEVLWGDVSASPVRGPDGVHLATVGVIADITDRKRAEEALLASEEKYRTLFEESFDGLFITTPGGRILDMNKKGVAMFGYDTKEEILRLDLERDVYAYPPDRQRILSIVNAQGSAEYEVVVKKKNREEMITYCSMTAVKDEKGVITSYRGIIRDITERKNIEEEMRAGVARLKEAQRVARIGSWELGVVTKQLSWSDETYRIFEIEPKAFGGTYEAFLDLIHPEDRDTVDRAYTASLANKTPYEIIHRLRFSDGRIKHVHERCEHVYDSAGIALRSVGTAQDITELTQVRLRLENERAQLRTLVQTIPDLVWLKDPDGVYLTCNPRFERFFGAKEADIVGKTDYDFVDAHVADFFRENDRKAIAAGKPSINEEWVTFADDGHSELLETIKTPMFDRDGSLMGVLGIARNITAARKAEEDQKRLATAIEQAVEAVLITDTKGIIQYVNPAMERTSGFSSEELLGKTSRVFKSGEHDATFYSQLWATIKDGNIWSGRLVNRRKDGRLFHEEATISPVKDASGTITNFVAVKRDITEHLELSKQLEQAQKMEAVGTLAGGIAHDFNNLLQVVLGYSEMILADEDLPYRLRDDLGKILLAGRNGADLVQRLLMFSRKTETRPLDLDLNQRIRSTRKFLERTIPKMIDIELILAEDLASIHADPTQMDQVLMNLSVNARDAMPEGGKLVIETTNVVIDEDYARSRLEAKPGKYVLLRVADTGSGMDKETMEHIFEPFYTTKGPGQGTGLGLAMVFGIVKQHHGFINCYSEVGRGTTFKIYLPAVITETRLDQPIGTSMPKGGTETILLVDDEEFVRALGKRLLERSGYTVLTAANGKEGLDLYKKEKVKISLVILDLIMPEMGGKQCLDGLLKIDPGVRVLITSGYSESGQTKDALEAGARGFVAKPYNIKQVLQSVREVLDSE